MIHPKLWEIWVPQEYALQRQYSKSDSENQFVAECMQLFKREVTIDLANAHQDYRAQQPEDMN